VKFLHSGAVRRILRAGSVLREIVSECCIDGHRRLLENCQNNPPEALLADVSRRGMQEVYVCGDGVYMAPRCYPAPDVPFSEDSRKKETGPQAGLVQPGVSTACGWQVG
jgi:hypothetical protein